MRVPHSICFKTQCRIRSIKDIKLKYHISNCIRIATDTRRICIRFFSVTLPVHVRIQNFLVEYNPNAVVPSSCVWNAAQLRDFRSFYLQVAFFKIPSVGIERINPGRSQFRNVECSRASGAAGSSGVAEWHPLSVIQAAQVKRNAHALS